MKSETKLSDSGAFNPDRRPTAKIHIRCAAERPWTMVLEPLGVHFEYVGPDEILTVEYVIFEEKPEIPRIIAIEADIVEVRISSPSDHFRILDSKGNELPI